METNKYCDKCNTKIINKECSCGQWFGRGDQPSVVKTFEEAILEFNKLNRDILSGDHFSGSCYILFKGNYDDCTNARKLIEDNILNKKEKNNGNK